MPAPEAPTVRCLTWNILAHEWVEETEGVDARALFNRSRRRAVILRHLRAFNADAMLLQEVGKDEHAALVAAFGDTHDVSSLWPITWSYDTDWNSSDSGLDGSDSPNQTESGNVTLLRKSVFGSVTHFAVDFGVVTNCTFEGRGACTFANVHLDDMCPRKRHVQLASLASHIRPDGSLAVVAGDFNHSYSSGDSLYGVLTDFTATNVRAPTYFFEQETCFLQQKATIDNVLARGFHVPGPAAVPAFPPSMASGLERFASDHLPVCALLCGVRRNETAAEKVVVKVVDTAHCPRARSLCRLDSKPASMTFEELCRSYPGSPVCG